MSATLELTDGATTLDLLGPPYRASQPVRIEPPGARPVLAGQALRGVHYSPRIVETDLNLKAADVTSLRSAIRALESLCSGLREPPVDRPWSPCFVAMPAWRL